MSKQSGEQELFNKMLLNKLFRIFDKIFMKLKQPFE